MRTKSIGLTKKQKEVLTVIKKFYAENKYPPSVRQIGEIIGINSPATIHVHLKGLVEKDMLREILMVIRRLNFWFLMNMILRVMRLLMFL